MLRFLHSASDEALIRGADEWVTLLEAEKYEEAYNLLAHVPEMGWTPELIREVIKAYGDEVPTQRATPFGVPSDVRQRKVVTRWAANVDCIGEVWYDLNIDGVASDLTATFDILQVDGGIVLALNRHSRHVNRRLT